MRKQEEQNRRIKRGEAGQATVEFALTLMLLLAFVLFYFQLAMTFAYGNFVQYATFMAARSYLAAGPNPKDQTAQAQDTIRTLLKRPNGSQDRWPGIARGVGGGEPAGAKIGPAPWFEPKNAANSWAEGVRYTFRSRLFLLPLGKAGGDPSLELTSESWLGRDPTYAECLDYMKAATENEVFIDNGC